MLYEITQKFINMNRSGRVLKAIGSVLHETGDPGATDENEQQYFNNAYRGASAHAFVDSDSITQTIPWGEQAGHAGPTANRNFIGIELCHYDDTAKFNEVWKRAVLLFAWVHVNILKLTTVTKDNLMSHAEVSQKWHETDHTDPVAYFAQFGKTVDDFRAAVQAEINNMVIPVKEEKRVDYIIVYSNPVDQEYADDLADTINCPTIHGDRPFDYRPYKNVICIGAPGKLGFTSYCTKLIQGANREETKQLVQNYKLNWRK